MHTYVLTLWVASLGTQGAHLARAPSRAARARALDVRLRKRGHSWAFRVPPQEFFEGNAASLNQSRLAVALRDIIVHGPAKTRRVPLLVGPSNSGKTTIILPFDDVFGHARVFHKPAPGSAKACRKNSARRAQALSPRASPWMSRMAVS